jgi:hypothetical protein
MATRCDLCDEDSNDSVVSKCNTCNIVLCEDHLKAHMKSRDTKNHDTMYLPKEINSIPLIDLTGIQTSSFAEIPAPSAALPLEPQRLMCREHPRDELKLICENCNILICRGKQSLQYYD